MSSPRGGVKLRMLVLTLALLLGVVASLVLLIWWQQEQIVFQPSGPPFPDTPTAERARYRAADGQELLAFLVRPSDVRPVGILLAFHGNADLAAWMVPWAEEVARRSGWLVMLAEYRGYGGLPGTPSVAGARLDARAAATYARDSLGATGGAFALYGHSLGSAIATELAMELPPDMPVSRLLLESPFTSARDMARVIIARPMVWTWSLISRVHYDTHSRARSLQVPISVAHGERDLVIPVRMGQAVFKAARVRGTLLIVPGAGHNDVSAIGQERYWTWLTGALSASTPSLSGDTLGPPQ